MIYDDRFDPPRFLMGLRGAGHVFMPGHLVFPGGKLEASDVRLAADMFGSRSSSRRSGGIPVAPLRGMALALAAIRETYEETGLMVCTPTRFRSRVPCWRDFAARGLRPNIHPLLPMARAITPKGLPRRYDTRFFLVSRSHSLVAASTPPTDEFDLVDWMTPEDAARFPLAGVTSAVLMRARERIATGRFGDLPHPLLRLGPSITAV